MSKDAAAAELPRILQRAAAAVERSAEGGATLQCVLRDEVAEITLVEVPAGGFFELPLARTGAATHVVRALGEGGAGPRGEALVDGDVVVVRGMGGDAGAASARFAGPLSAAWIHRRETDAAREGVAGGSYTFRPASGINMERFEAESIEVDGHRFRDEHMSVAEVRVDAGVLTALHVLKITERYVIFGGRGIMDARGLPRQPVTRGDVVHIPPGTAQRILAAGDEPVRMFCLCTPPFLESEYVQVEAARGGVDEAAFLASEV